MSDTDEFKVALRAEVLRVADTLDQAAVAVPASAHVPAPLRRRRPVRTAVAAAVAVSAAVVALVFGADVASAGVDIVRDGDDLVVTLTDLNTAPDEIVAAAREFGLDVDVDTVATGPSMVGRFVNAEGDTLPAELRRLDVDPQGSFDGFRIPADWKGRLELSLGREARPGEPWSAFSSVDGFGEPLACEPVAGAALGVVLSRLEAAGLDDVRVVEVNVEVPQEQWGDDADATVVRAMRTSDRTVVIDVAPAGAPTPVDRTGVDPRC